MTTEQFIENIKLELTGGILDLEIDDKILEKVVKRSLQEVQRFIDTTQYITVPYASCIDFSNCKINDVPIDVSSVMRIYRAEGLTGDTEAGGQSVIDPMYVQTWMAFTNGGTMYNLNDYVLNYMSYNTLMQMRNTTSTDLAWRQDHQANKLYINSGFDKPAYVTIEYVPQFKDVSEIKSNYWIDIIQRLSVAHTKVILGRIRTRFTASNSLWTQDGEKMLEEGNTELTALREVLRKNSQIILPMD